VPCRFGILRYPSRLNRGSKEALNQAVRYPGYCALGSVGLMLVSPSTVARFTISFRRTSLSTSSASESCSVPAAANGGIMEGETRFFGLRDMAERWMDDPGLAPMEEMLGGRECLGLESRVADHRRGLEMVVLSRLEIGDEQVEGHDLEQVGDMAVPE